MSCCNDSYNGLPCCCHLGFPTTTTTTCPFDICCDPSCEDATVCSEVYLTDCIRYEGPSIPCYDINPGDTYTSVLENIIKNLSICFTTTSTTTTTTTIP